MYNFNIMDLILQVFLSVFSGILLSLAIPNEIYNLGQPIFTLISLVPLYLTLTKINSYKRAFLIFFIQTITTHLLSSFWLAFFKDFAVFTLGASALGTAVIGGGVGLFFYIPFSTSKSHNQLNEESYNLKFVQSSSFKILYFAICYTIYEWIKSSGFLGYPWGTVSSAVFRWDILKQTAAITGTYGITFIIVLFNCIFSESLLKLQDKKLYKKTTSNSYLSYLIKQLMQKRMNKNFFSIINFDFYIWNISIQQNN